MKAIAILAAVLWIAPAALADDASALPPAPAPMLSVAELAQDLSILRYTLEAAHPRLYAYTPKPEMDSAFVATAARLTRPMSDLEFYRCLAPLLDRIHDSHTSTHFPPEMVQRIRRAPVFPLDLRWAGDHVLVEKNFGPNREIPIRGEVVSINGRSMSEIADRTFAGRSADGFNRSAKQRLMNSSFWFYYRALVDTTATFQIEIRDPASGRTTLYRTPGAPVDSLEHGQAALPRHTEFSFEVIEGGRVGLMTLPTFGDTLLPGKLRTAFAEIERKKIGELILDVRNNGGGFDELNTELLQYLVPHPYRFYQGFTYVARDTSALRYLAVDPQDFWNTADLRRMSKQELAETFTRHSFTEIMDRNVRNNPAAGVRHPSAKSLFRGRLYVLAHGGSASSAAEVPALLHFQGIGTQIGEEPNGAYQGVTAGILEDLVLPNSKLRVIVPLIAYHNAVLPGLFVGHGALPQFEVAQTLDDILAGKDTVLQFTLALIRARTAP